MNNRLNEIETSWERLFASHTQELSGCRDSQALVLQRYYGAVWSFLYYFLKDSHLADDFSQEFALRFLRGDFREAHPDKGRFRDFVKVVLRNMALDYYRHGRKHSSDEGIEEIAAPGCQPSEQLEQQFNYYWRLELLRRTWDSFRRMTLGSRPLYFESLSHYATGEPLTSEELARRLTSIQGDQVKPAAARQILHRARKMFANCLRTEVQQSLASENSSDITVEEELRDLQLTKYLGPVTANRSSR